VKFLADENVDKAIVEHLRKEGHVVLYVIEKEPSISDDQVIQRANQESALLLTADKDFGDLVFRQGRISYGVVLIRLAGLSPQRKAEVVAKVVQEHANELNQNFTVITPGAVRIRK
jgi:predicted nuclease of predicted toxin-antitoxin system